MELPRQFRILFHHFLFRAVDIELLSPEGDITKLLGQFAAALILVGFTFPLRLMNLTARTPPDVILRAAWGTEHAVIAATMLAVGLFAVLSWDSTFPDRRDVYVLAPLPVRSRTLFFAKVSALATALGVTVATLNAATAAALPLAIGGAGSLLEFVFSVNTYRMFAAFWVTVFAAGIFISGSVLCLQAVAALLLPRRLFLRASAALQVAAFCLFVSVYFLEPAFATPAALGAERNQQALSWLPSYWFLGLFHQLNGSMHDVMRPLANRAWIALSAAFLGAVGTYTAAYLRTLRRIVEQPDIAPQRSRLTFLPPMGDSLTTAIVHFSVRTLMRSRQHRVVLAFYLGLAFAAVVLFLQTPRSKQLLHDASSPVLFITFILMCAIVAGTRVVLAVPMDVRANWIFRLTEVRGPAAYIRAGHKAMFVLAVAPVCAAVAAVLFTLWPWVPAARHLTILATFGATLAWLSLYGFHRIPFTCSWLPGRIQFHLAFLAVPGVLFLLGWASGEEARALADPVAFAQAAGALVFAALLARWWTRKSSHGQHVVVEYQAELRPAVIALGLTRDGVWAR